MATVTPTGTAIDLRTLTAMVRTMFPHARFPDGPYERTAAAIVDAAQGDVRMGAQLEQGMRELDAVPRCGRRSATRGRRSRRAATCTGARRPRLAARSARGGGELRCRARAATAR